MNKILTCLCQLFLSIVAIQKDDLLLNGLEFPSHITIPLDKTYSLECNSESRVYWKLYLNNGDIQIRDDKLIQLNEFDYNRDGLYQCHLYNDPLKSRRVFIFSNGARFINRNWTTLTKFHENFLTICQPIYFNYGFNEQFIELIDKKQLIRYNHSAILIKHIRSTTHLFCKLYIDTTTVGIRVQTLLQQNLDTPLLSDAYLKTNEYFEMNTNEQDVYRIAFEGDSVYFHCPITTSSAIQWNFLAYNSYTIKTLPVLYDKDMKISSVKISDAGMYRCQTENTIHKRIILTIIHPPISRENIYEHTLQVNFDSKYLICCHLDAIPYPTYSWTMMTEIQSLSVIWCTKRCCWLDIIYKKYDNVICTSANHLGKATYKVHLIVNDADSKNTIVYDQSKFHNHDLHSLDIDDNDIDEEKTIENILSINSDIAQSNENLAREFRESIVEYITNEENGTNVHINIKQELKKDI